MGSVVRGAEQEEIEELLDELERNLSRLRIDYEQFFMGNMRREPQALRGKVQKSVLKLVNEPPRQSRQKFRFNTLNARFQVYRQLWGRTLREMERGTYKRDRFKLAIKGRVPPEPVGKAAPAKARKKGSAIDQLHGALEAARAKTGEGGGVPSAQELGRIVRKQMDAIRAKHGDVNVKFRVVIENNKAKVKASVGR